MRNPAHTHRVTEQRHHGEPVRQPANQGGFGGCRQQAEDPVLVIWVEGGQHELLSLGFV